MDTLFEDGLDISVEAEQLRTLDEQARDLESLMATAVRYGGVSKQTAIDLESISPGVITNRRQLNSYTRDFTLTNFKATMEDAEQMRKGLIYAGIAALALILAKILSWIFGAFGGDSGGGGGGGGGGKSKKGPQDEATIRLTVVVTQKSIDLTSKYITEMNDVLVRALTTNGVSQAIKVPADALYPANNIRDAGTAKQFLTTIYDKTLVMAIKRHAVPFINAVVSGTPDGKLYASDVQFLTASVTLMFNSISERTKEFAEALKDPDSHLDTEKFKIHYQGGSGNINVTSLAELKAMAEQLHTTYTAGLTTSEDTTTAIMVPLEKLVHTDFKMSALNATHVGPGGGGLNTKVLAAAVEQLNASVEKHKQIRRTGVLTAGVNILTNTTAMDDTEQTHTAKAIRDELSSAIVHIAKCLGVLAKIRNAVKVFYGSLLTGSTAIETFYKEVHTALKGIPEIPKDILKEYETKLKAFEKAMKEVAK